MIMMITIMQITSEHYILDVSTRASRLEFWLLADVSQEIGDAIPTITKT